MSYEEVMNTILPHQGNHAAHITGHYGEVRAKGPHGGSDMNYEGGQAGINLIHPSVHSPISGEVTFVGGQYGTIKIRDAQGNSHELLHTATQSVKVGQHVTVGDEIGAMGGRGPHGATQYAQHVHYQMKDPHVHAINPEAYWNLRTAEVGARSPSAVEGKTIQPHSLAPAADALGQGAGGPAVHDLQAHLAKLGYKDGHGHPLKADGDFGIDTRHAVERFQHDHHLKVDGVAGPKILDAIHHAQARHVAPSLADPKNPDHALYEQARAAVHQLDASMCRTSDRHSDQLAASLVVAAKRERMKAIDTVVLSEDGSRAFAVQGRPDSPTRQVAHVPTAEAVNTPIDKSNAAAHALNQQQAQQPPTQSPVTAQAQSAPAIAL